jgi:hypothetical protein
MRTETIIKEIYTFDELSEEAKEKAREWFKKCYDHEEWWLFVFEDVTIIADIFGLDIENIYFSGFSSQGDGACFEGDYSYKKGGLKAVKEYAPMDKELHGIVRQLQDIQKPAFYRLTATTKNSGRYSHSGCMSVDVECYDESGHWDCLKDNQEQEITDELRCFADWIYDKLEKEYWWLMSDESVDENIRINEYEFTGDGEIY